jgi:hypothetical protein
MTTSTLQDIQAEILSAIRKSPQTALDAVKTWVETVQTFTPKLPQVHLPLADHLPTPKQAVAGAYDVAEALLASQRKFAEGMLETVAPLFPGSRESKPKD